MRRSITLSRGLLLSAIASFAAAMNAATPPILWTPPTAIESKDLFLGAAGTAGAPDLTVRFRPVKTRVPSISRRMVQDTQGRNWEVFDSRDAFAAIAANRIAEALGFETLPIYFAPHVLLTNGGDLRNVGLIRVAEAFAPDRKWDWSSVALAGTPAIDSLKVLMAIIGNNDLTGGNNWIYRAADGRESYRVIPLGRTFGKGGSFLTRTSGDPTTYAADKIAVDRHHERVTIHCCSSGSEVLSGIDRGHALAFLDLVKKLSDEQLKDAFKAGGFSPDAAASFAATFRNRAALIESTIK